MSAVILSLSGPEVIENFQRSALAIREGKLVAFPTETFYALGADPRNEKALKALYRLKGRRSDKPVLLLIGDRTWAEELWAEVDPRAYILMDAFWPGPLTLIAPPSAGAPSLPGARGLALRFPARRQTIDFLKHIGAPITGTSANPGGRPPPSSAAEVERYFPAGLDIILDGGTSPGFGVSTLVDVSPGKVEIIRHGILSEGNIFEALKKGF